MNPEVKEKWLDALRSGKYRQTQNKLRNETGTAYCCLGVLCDIYAQEGRGFWIEHTAEEGYITRYEFVGSQGDKSDIYLPEAVQDWAGLPDAEPFISPQEGINNPITTFNDEEGWTFEEIADLIEREW